MAKPLTTQFVKRQPRLTKPLELKKRPQPRRRTVRREMVAVKARMQRDQNPTGPMPAQTLERLARPSVEIARGRGLGAPEHEPRITARAIQGARELEKRIDLSLELLDIRSLETGRYHAMVLQDPKDKRNLQGYCRLSWLYIPRLHESTIPQTGGRGASWAEHYIGGCVRNLAEAVNEYTAIRTYVGERVSIDTPEALRVPWVFHLFFFRGYGLSDSELEILGRYLVGGGFLFADASPHQQLSVASSHIQNLTAALETQGVRADLGILPRSHPMYHCYFDFTVPPMAADVNNRLYPGQCEQVDYLEGWEVGGRLVAVLSRKGYYWPWTGEMRSNGVDSTRQFQFGVNVIVFALTQEGSITHQLLSGLEY